jgi:hypothetical protein
MLLLYAVSALAYAQAFAQASADIKSSANGNGIFPLEVSDSGAVVNALGDISAINSSKKVASINQVNAQNVKDAIIQTGEAEHKPEAEISREADTVQTAIDSEDEEPEEQTA